MVKDLHKMFNPSLKAGTEECDNFYFLDILIRFKFYFIGQQTTNFEEWLPYVDTLKACFIIMGAVKECEEI